VIIVSLLLIFAAVVLLVVGVANHADPALIGSIIATLLAVVVLIGSARRAASVRLAAADGTGVAPTVNGGQPVGMVIDGTVVERPATRAPSSTPPPRQAPPPAVDPFDAVDPFQPGTTVREAAQGGTILVDEADEFEGAATIPTQPSSLVEVDLDDEDLDEPAIDLGLAPANRSGLGDDELGEFEDEDPPDEPAVQLVSPADQALIARMETNVLVVDGRPRYHLARCPHLTGRATEALPVREALELGFSPCARCEPATALLAGVRPS
jgi:hypothetical protein